MDTVMQTSPQDTEIIVVDNGSQDDSVAMLQSQFPQACVIEAGRNLGFSGANNLGIQASRGQYVLLLNSDTLVHPGALQAMIRYLDTHSDTGAAGCRLEYPDGSLQRNCYKFPSPIRAIAENLLLTAAFPNNPILGDYRAWPHDKVRDVDFIIGAALMVRRTAINQVGLMDEGFFLYSEETDWCKRMHQAGWRVTFVPDGTVVHLGGHSSRDFKERQFCESNRSAMRYIRKHHGPAGAFIYRLAMLVGAVLRVSVWGIAALLLPRRRDALLVTVRLWCHIFRWYLGLGPHEGIRELANAR